MSMSACGRCRLLQGTVERTAVALAHLWPTAQDSLSKGS